MDDAALTSGMVVAEPLAGADEPVCIRCGYSLTGLEARRPCPECGLLAGFSLLDGHELRHNRPRWLRLLSIGAALLALGTLLAPTLPASMALMLVAPSAGRQMFPPARVNWTVWAIGVSAAMLVALLLAAGIWLLTRSPGRQRADPNSGLRGALRSLSALPLVIMSITAMIGSDLWSSGPLSEWLFLLLAVPFIILAPLLFVHLRSLAIRAPAPLLAADSPIVGGVLGACLAMLLVTAFITAWKPDILARGTAGTIMVLFMVLWLAVGLTAFFWSIYLLIRYAVAFASSARQARRLMEQFDASRNPMPPA